MADEPIDAASKRTALGDETPLTKRKNELVFADQIVQTRKAIDSARELLNQVGGPRSSK